MRQYLVLTLVVTMAGGILVAGCTTNSASVKRMAYVDEHPELPELMADAITNGQIMVGMTEEMVEVSWGKPARVDDVSENIEDATVQWIYGNYFTGGNITTLFFDEQGTLLRYEVNNAPAHANTGTVETGATSTSQAAVSGKGSGGQP
jgi:hypothetical protein